MSNTARGGGCVPPPRVSGWSERSLPGADLVGLLPEFLGLLRVVLENLVALELVGPAVERGRGEVGGRLARTREDLVGDRLAVDRHRDRLTAQRAFLVRAEVLDVLADRQGLVERAGLVHRRSEEHTSELQSRE